MPEARSRNIPAIESVEFYSMPSIIFFYKNPQPARQERHPKISRLTTSSRATRPPAGVTMSVNPIFNQFNRLPLELQDMIWTFTLPGPRTVKVSKSHRGGLYSPCIPPPTLSICKHSRSVAKRDGYALAFAMSNAPARIYANFNIDQIYFDNSACPPEHFPLPPVFTSAELNTRRDQRRHSTEERQTMRAKDKEAKMAFYNMGDLAKVQHFGLSGAVWKPHIKDLINDLIPRLHSLKCLILTFEYDDKYLSYGLPKNGVDHISLLQTQVSRMSRLKAEVREALENQFPYDDKEMLRKDVERGDRSGFQVGLKILTSRMVNPWVSAKRREREMSKAKSAVYKHANYYSIERSVVAKRAQDVLNRINKLAEACDEDTSKELL
jgi:hypothetical protein